MSEPENPVRDQVRELEAREQRARVHSPHLRAVAPPEPDEPLRPAHVPAPVPGPLSQSPPLPPPAPRISRAADPPSERLKPLQRAMNGLRAALPIVQKVLPLLDGQVATAVSNLLVPHAAAHTPPVDLAPLEGGLTDLRTRHIELFNKVAEQNTSLKRVADRLERVQETADRTAQDQQELKVAVQVVGRKANIIAVLALCLLAASLAANVLLFLHFQRPLR
jgi:hypothetical protein